MPFASTLELRVRRSSTLETTFSVMSSRQRRTKHGGVCVCVCVCGHSVVYKVQPCYCMLACSILFQMCCNYTGVLICRTFLVLPELDDEVGVWESCKSKPTTFFLVWITTILLLTNRNSSSPKCKSLHTQTLYQVSTGDCRTWSLSWLKATPMGNGYYFYSLSGGRRLCHKFKVCPLSTVGDYSQLCINLQAHSCWLKIARYRVTPQSYKSIKNFCIIYYTGLLLMALHCFCMISGHCSRDGEQLPKWAWELIKMWYVV